MCPIHVQRSITGFVHSFVETIPREPLKLTLMEALELESAPELTQMHARDKFRQNRHSGCSESTFPHE